MAPKHRGSVLGAPVTTGKRTARRPARQPSPSSSSTSSASTPSAIPGHSTPQVDLLAGRVITMGRKVDFEFFEAEGFSIGRQIRDMGWEKVCSLDVPTYPALVKDFYLNLSRGDGGLVSFVRGTRIHLTSEILGRLLEIPISGPIANAHDDRGAALSRMLGRKVVDFEEIRANQLPLELRLLHNICSRILFPKTGRFEYVSERDILVMDAVVTGQPINLSGMMIWYMAEAGGKKRSSLPYDMILTIVFQKQGVVISDSEPMKTLRHTDYYSLATLHRMRFAKVNGRWERKGSMDDRDADVDTEVPGPSVVRPPVTHSPGPSSSIPPAAPAPVPTLSVQTSTGFSETQMEQLKSLFMDQENRLNAKLEEHRLSMRQLFYSLEDKVSLIESSFGSSANALKIDLMKIFEKIKDIGGDSEIYSKCNAELQDKITTAAALVEKLLTDFIKIQGSGMEKILEELKKLLRFGY